MKVHTGKNKGRYVLRTVKSGPNKGKKYRVYLKPGQKAPAAKKRVTKKAPAKKRVVKGNGGSKAGCGKRDMEKVLQEGMARYNKEYGKKSGAGTIKYTVSAAAKAKILDYLKRLERYGLENAKKEAIRRVTEGFKQGKKDPYGETYDASSVKWVKEKVGKIGSCERAWKYMIDQIIYEAFQEDLDSRSNEWEKQVYKEKKTVTLAMSAKGAKNGVSYGDWNPAVYFKRFI